jgi:hypothetical protein
MAEEVIEIPCPACVRTWVVWPPLLRTSVERPLRFCFGWQQSREEQLCEYCCGCSRCAAIRCLRRFAFSEARQLGRDFARGEAYLAAASAADQLFLALEAAPPAAAEAAPAAPAV